MTCLICGSQQLNSIHCSSGEVYHHCQDCDYIFLQPKFRLSSDAEKGRYLEHNNDISDPRYLQYLEKTWKKISAQVKSGLVMDFGCGPSRGLKQVLKDQDYEVVSYDPIFYPINFEERVNQVDAVFCSEAIEHSYEPLPTFRQMNRVLKNDGWITLRTAFHPGAEAFNDWWYKDDATHVGFFSEKTLEQVAETLGWKIQHIHSPYVVFQKAR